MLFILILFLSLIAQFFLPWWVITAIAFALAAWNGQSEKKSFWNGFSAIFILWVCMALFRSLPNENLLANRVAQMLMLPVSDFNWLILTLITGVLGGLVAGTAALAGAAFKKGFFGRRR